MTTQTQTAPVVLATGKSLGISAVLASVNIKKRFEEILGKKAPAFISSIITAVNTNAKLQEADPMTVVSSAVVAATLDLPINSSLGFAHIVPYKGKAQFQMGWRGFVQLAIRTGQYATMNVSEVYEGQLKKWNRLTGEFEADPDAKTSEKIIGYVAFFRLVNGFEKYLYMTKEEVLAHGRKYSQSFDSPNGKWKLDEVSMSLKTVIKRLLSKWGILSVEMQRAIAVDQGVITISGNQEMIEYPDATETAGETDAEAEMPKRASEVAAQSQPAAEVPAPAEPATAEYLGALESVMNDPKTEGIFLIRDTEGVNYITRDGKTAALAMSIIQAKGKAHITFNLADSVIISLEKPPAK